MAKSGRNAPCPCGSGRKYKLCCLERAADEKRRARTIEAIWQRLQEWTIAEHAEHLDAAIDDLCGDDRSMSPDTVALLCSYAHLDRELPAGGTPAQRFRDLPGLGDAERAAAASLAEARLGLWRVRSVESGTSIGLEEVFGDRALSVGSDRVSRATARWDVLLGRVMSDSGRHELWGPAAIFAAREEDELVEEVQRLALEHSIPALAAFRVCAAQLLRFVPPSRREPVSFFTLEGDPLAEAHARWELEADDAWMVLERHPDLVEIAQTEDGEGTVLEWTAPRRELTARRPELPPRAVVFESSPVFADLHGNSVTADAGRVGLGTFELRRRLLSFDAISARRLEDAIALVADTIGEGARLVERRVEPLEQVATASAEAPDDDEPIPGEVREAVIAAFASDRFRRMLDEPDPRFDGLTPREAARSAEQRSGLERWLRTLENTAAHGTAADGFAPDVAMIRRELAMPDHALAA